MGIGPEPLQGFQIGEKAGTWIVTKCRRRCFFDGFQALSFDEGVSIIDELIGPYNHRDQGELRKSTISRVKSSGRSLGMECPVFLKISILPGVLVICLAVLWVDEQIWV